MYALVEYDPNDNKVKSVKMMCDIGVHLQPDGNKSKFVYAYMNETAGDAEIISKLMTSFGSNDIRLNDFPPPRGREPKITFTVVGAIEPYSRKLTVIDQSVRQAAYRSGTTSFFKNL